MRVILELDEAQLSRGFITVTKVDDQGRRTGKKSADTIMHLMQRVFERESGRRQVQMVSRFDNEGLIAFGQSGSKWVAVQEIPPSEYYLLSVSGRAYPVHIPRLVVRVTNYGNPLIFWTAETGELSPESQLYPLAIGNTTAAGETCLGTTGLRCQAPGEINQFIRKVIESPATGDYLSLKTNLDQLYERLTRGWDPSIGRQYPRRLRDLINAAD